MYDLTPNIKTMGAPSRDKEWEKIFVPPEEELIIDDSLGQMPFSMEGQKLGTDLPKEVFRQVRRTVGWEVDPPFESQGRSAWLHLREPVEVEGGDSLVSFQLKGVGYRHEQRVFPPGGGRYFTTIAGLQKGRVDICFDERGNIGLRALEPPIWGAMGKKDAKTEFNALARLRDVGINAPHPIRWFEYIDVEHAHGVVLGSTFDPRELKRALEYFLDQDHLMREVLKQRGDRIEGVSFNVRANLAMNFFREIAMERGRSLREINDEAQITRIQSHMGNMTYSPDGNFSVVHDLEGAVDMENVPDKVKPLLILENLARGAFTMLFAYAESEYFFRMVVQGDEALYGPNINPVYAYLKGFFHDQMGDANFDQIMLDVSRMILHLFLQKLVVRDGGALSFSAESVMQSHMEVICKSMAALRELYVRSDLESENSFPYDIGNFLLRLKSVQDQHEAVNLHTLLLLGRMSYVDIMAVLMNQGAIWGEKDRVW